MQLLLANPLFDITSPEGEAIHIVIPPDTFVDPDGDACSLRVTLADGLPLPPWLSFDSATSVISGTPPAGFSGALSVRVVAIELPEQPAGDTPVGRSGLTVTFTGSPLLRLDAASDTGTAGDNTTFDRTPTLFGDAPAGTAKVELRFFDPFDLSALRPAVEVAVDASGHWSYTPDAPFVPVGHGPGGGVNDDGVEIRALALRADGSAVPGDAPLTDARLTLTFKGSELIALAGDPDSAATGSATTDDRTPTFTGHVPAGASQVELRFLTPGTLAPVLDSVLVDVAPDGTWSYTLANPTALSNFLVIADAQDAAGVDVASSPIGRSGLTVTFTGSPLLRLDPASDTGTAGDNTTFDRTPTLLGDAPAATAKVELHFFDPFDLSVLRPAVEVAVDASGHWSYTPDTPFVPATHGPGGVINDDGVEIRALALRADGSRVPGDAPLTDTVLTLTFKGSELIALAGDPDSAATGSATTDDRTPTFTGHAPAGASQVELRFLDTTFTPVLDSVVADVAPDGTWSYTLANPTALSNFLVVADAQDAAGIDVAPSPIGRSGLTVTFTGSPLLRLDAASDTEAAGDNTTFDRTPTLFGDAPAGTAKVELHFFDPFDFSALRPSVEVTVDASGHWSYTPDAPFVPVGHGPGGGVNDDGVEIRALALRADGSAVPGDAPLTDARLTLTFKGSELIALAGDPDSAATGSATTDDRTPTFTGHAPAGASLIELQFLTPGTLAPVLDSVLVDVAPGGTWSYTLANPTARSDMLVFATALQGASPAVADVFALDINDAPVAQLLTLVTPEDTPVGGTLQASDTESDPVTFALVSGSAVGGTVSAFDAQSGAFTFTPNHDFDGAASFRFTTSDATSTSASASVSIDVTPVNDAPVVGAPVKLAPVEENAGARLITQAELIANASDVDGNALAALGLAIASGGGTLVDHHDGTWSYTPAAHDSSAVSFSYRVSDGVAPAVVDSATLDILPAPQAPPIPVTGTPGDDSFTAGKGDQAFDAGLGHDTIAFDFRLVDATVSYLGHKVVVDSATSHTVLSGFEAFVFTDGKVDNRDADVLVDDLYYYSTYHEVWTAHLDADAHFHNTGWREGHNPNAFFSTALYLAANTDVKAAGVDPLIHFDQSGWKEGRVPSIAFDPVQYLAAYPDVKAAGVDPLAHFLKSGAEEGRDPFAPRALVASDGFDYVYYLQHNPDVAAAGVDPFEHFRTIGWHEGRNPNALFDVNGYLAAYADVKAAGINPLDHYDTSGWREGRDPSVGFDTSEYLAHYPDVAAAHVDPLVHYLQFGVHEGRQAFGDGVWG